VSGVAAKGPAGARPGPRHGPLRSHLDEPVRVLQARDDRALEPRERRRAPVGSRRTAVTPSRRQAADVPFGAVLSAGTAGSFREVELLVTVLGQPLPDPHAVGMTQPGLEHQFVEPIDHPPVGLIGLRAAEFIPVLA
jgi:hypothetical protein